MFVHGGGEVIEACSLDEVVRGVGGIFQLVRHGRLDVGEGLLEEGAAEDEEGLT